MMRAAEGLWASRCPLDVGRYNSCSMDPFGSHDFSIFGLKSPKRTRWCSCSCGFILPKKVGFAPSVSLFRAVSITHSTDCFMCPLQRSLRLFCNHILCVQSHYSPPAHYRDRSLRFEWARVQIIPRTASWTVHFTSLRSLLHSDKPVKSDKWWFTFICKNITHEGSRYWGHSQELRCTSDMCCMMCSHMQLMPWSQCYKHHIAAVQQIFVSIAALLLHSPCVFVINPKLKQKVLSMLTLQN